jgi:biopolymer transport protein ExbB/TolQ
MNISPFFWNTISNSVYIALGIDALWGVYCVIMVFARIARIRFRNEARQDEFLESLNASMQTGDVEGAIEQCDGDRRALAQLAHLALLHRYMDIGKVQEMLVDRFQRDVLANMEHRVSWINNVIKTAPMLGLLGTVLGMMAAFGKLAVQSATDGVKPDQLASDISFALITTAIGLAIAIPGTLCIAAINVRLRKLEDLVGAGLARFLDDYAAARKNWHGRATQGARTIPPPAPVRA